MGKAIGVRLTRTSPVTGKSNTMFLPTTSVKVQAFLRDRSACDLVQDMFPELNRDQREFLLTGMTPGCFETLEDSIDFSRMERH